MKICIIGAGAMGSVYGGLLAEAGNEVFFLDVFKEHIDSINEYGLWMEGSSGERYIKGIEATSHSEEVGIVDLAIVFVKSTITDCAIKQNKDVIGENTIVLTLQNGLGNIEKLETVVTREQIITGTTSHGAILLGPGRIKHAGHGTTVIGELGGAVTQRIQQIAQVFEHAKLDPIQISTNIMGTIWDKVLVNVGINPLTALTGLKNGQLLDYPEMEWILENAVKEAEKVAKVAGVVLMTPDPVNNCREVAKVTSENISSMLADVNNKRRTEISNINGAIVKLGKRHNISTPINEVLTNLILLKEQMY